MLSRHGSFWASQQILVAESFLIARTGFAMVLITREQLFLIGTRQAYLSLKPNIGRLSSRVVLFLFAPGRALKKENLQEVFGAEAERSWIVSSQGGLEKMVGERNNKAMTLEAAQIDLASKANEMMSQKGEAAHPDGIDQCGDGSSLQVPGNLRPRTRVTPFIGQKVDTINWTREELPNMQRTIEERGANHEYSAKPGKSAIFVAFAAPIVAERAYQTLNLHGLVSQLVPERFIGVEAREVFWSNLTLSRHDRLSRQILATILVVATILFWAVPVAFVGAISNIKYLANNVDFLDFLSKLPDAIIGLLSGLLPPLAISALVSLVPKIFRCKYLPSPVVLDDIDWG